MKSMFLVLCVLAFCLSVLPAGAQDATTVTPGTTGVTGAAAAITNNNLWLYGFPGGALQVTRDAGFGFAPPYYHSPVWSPDGIGLAFIRVDQDYNQSLMYLDTSSDLLNPITLDTNLEIGFPAIFNDDGSQILYIGEGDLTTLPYQVNVKSVGTLTGAVPSVLGTFGVISGCGGGSPYPVDGLYNQEAGYGGTGLVLALSPFGLIHSTNCGGRGVALFNLDNGQNTALNEDLSRAVLSPDGLRLAGILDPHTESKRLAIFDLQSRTLQELTTQSAPDQIGWSDDGAKIFYSVRVPSGGRLFTIDASSAAYPVLVNNGIVQQGETSIQLWDVALRVYDVFTRTEQLLYTSDAYAIGRIRAEGENVLFSQVPNMTQWLQGIVNTGGAQSAFDADVLQTALISMNPVNAEVNLLGLDFGQFTFINAVIPPFAAAAGALPTTTPQVQTNADGTVNVGQVVMRQFSVASTVDGAGCAVDNPTAFTPGSTINAVASMDNLQPGTVLDVIWSRGGQQISTGSYQHTGNFTQGCLYFFIAQTSTPAGSYSVVLKVDGQDAAAVDFVVQ